MTRPPNSSQNHGNSSQNHGVVLPKGVGFFPNDQEIIQLFLTPRIKQKEIKGCPIQAAGSLYPIISGEAGAWDVKDYPYFRKNHYWFFVQREPVKRGSGFFAQRRVIGPQGDLLGTWKSSSKSKKVKKGNLVLGFKQKLEFMTKDDLNSGWYQIEYTRYSKTFEETAVSHLVYDKESDQVAHANLQRDHGNQENGKEGFRRDPLAEGNKVGPLAHEIKIETGALPATSKIKIEMDALADMAERNKIGPFAHEIKIETGALADTSEIKTETSA